MLLGGRLGDLFGRRTTFVTGMVGFAAASVVGGAATSFDILVAARVAQGLFSALLAPAALSLLSVTFSGAGAAVGLLLGGMLTEWASWRWVMYVNVVFAGVALAGALLLPAKPVVTERPKIDIPGAATVGAALFGIVYGFAHVESTSWTDPVALGSMISGVVLLAVFAWLERRVAHPLLPLRVVLDRTPGLRRSRGLSGVVPIWARNVGRARASKIMWVSSPVIPTDVRARRRIFSDPARP
ncbi:hypothetical protein GCM10010269_56340 [Streptomyces humidus]|uniref:Major facilitator superfamily (MFS) profile domain-containing protein n=1 Tax=Streptomyces humidus TaxID=52259 RepID=A0A918G0L3_9ACTN|nr:hypothetical protein GCM10010269_56340 [Streptomyces humidus]